MRTSLNEIEQIEAHLLKQSDGPEETLFEAKLLLNNEFAEKVSLQQHTYEVIHEYGRRQLRQELDIVHRKLFTEIEHLGFRKRIMAFFH